MRMQPGQGRKDATGSLTRKRSLLWTHPAILNRNQDLEAQRVAQEVLRQQQKEEQEAEREAKEIAKDNAKEVKRLKEEARDAVHSAEIWQCMNMECGHVGSADEEWKVCEYALLRSGQVIKGGCQLFICAKPACGVLMDAHERNCLYRMGGLEAYHKEQAAKAPASKSTRSHRKAK